MCWKLQHGDAVVHPDGASPPVLHGAFAELRRVDHMPCHVRLGNPVPHGDDVQQQLQLCDGNV